MRTIIFPNPDRAAANIADLARLGPAGGLAADFLARCLADERLVERSFALYLDVLRAFARAFGHTPATAVLTPDAIQAFVAHHSHGKPWRERLARAVLRRLLSVTHGEAAASLVAAPGDGAVSVAPDLEQLTAVDREAAYVLRRVAGRFAERVASADELRRAGLVAMCRHAGAMASDLAAMTLDDIAPGWRWAGTVGPSWRAVRALRRGRGEAKRQEFAVEIPLVVRHAIERWLTVRLHGPVQGGALLWASWESGEDDAPVLRPLDRRDVYNSVAGIGDPTSGERHVRDFPSYRPVEPSKSAGGAPALSDEATDAPTRIEINPALLRHCLALEVTRAHPDSHALVDAMARRMGVAGRGLGPRYRKLLGITSRAPQRARRRSPAGPAA